MKKTLILFVTLLGAFSAAAQSFNLPTTNTRTKVETVSQAAVVRGSGNFSMVNVHFPEFPNRFQLGGGASLSAAYEQPIALRGVFGAGLGGSFEKTTALDPEYYYRNLHLSSIYAEIYYGFHSQSGFFFDLGLQGGYTPPILSLTAAPDYEGGLKLRRLSPYQCKMGNVWFSARVGYCFLMNWEVALSLRYAMLSPFGEAFPYPMLNVEQEATYRDVQARHLSAGISIGYRIKW